MRTTYSFPDQSKKRFSYNKHSIFIFFKYKSIDYYVCFQVSIIQIRSIEEHQLFTSSCLYEGSCLIYVICVCLCIVVSNTYYVVFFSLFLSVLCTLCCQFLWIVHLWLPLRYSLAFIYRLNRRMYNNAYIRVLSLLLC